MGSLRIGMPTSCYFCVVFFFFSPPTVLGKQPRRNPNKQFELTELR